MKRLVLEKGFATLFIICCAFVSAPEVVWSQPSVVDDDDHHGAILRQKNRVVVFGSEFRLSEDDYLRDLLVLGGTAEVYGEVENLVVLGGDVFVGASANITGNFEVVGGRVDWENEEDQRSLDPYRDWSESHTWNFVIDDWRDLPYVAWWWEGPGVWFLRFFKWMLFSVFALTFFRLAPGYHERVAKRLRTGFLNSWGVGFLVCFLMFPLSLFLVLTLIGIPLLPILYSILFIFFVLAYLHVARWISPLSWKKTVGEMSFSRTFWSTFVGLFLLEVLGLWSWGAFLITFLVLAAFGAVFREAFLRVSR